MSPEHKPTASFALSLTSGILGFIFAIIIMAIFVGYAYPHYVLWMPGLAIWFSLCSILVIIGATLMYIDPKTHKTWGIIILIFSIISGAILGIIGGALAIAWKPHDTATTILTTTSIRVCPECGRVMTQEVKFCPYCGKEFS